ncbi:MAG TPA: F0F1 ATP synthase subunit B [Gammaproteobacteria bacterium]|nr:F0F1 ATP synthase subunit B [Gammaproteobacteria bacterium]
MNINVTLIIQIISFVVMIWLVNKYLWRPISALLEQRQQRIADGLAAAEKGKHERELAEKHAKETLSDAKSRSAEIIAQAERRAGEIVEESKAQARSEGERLVEAANAEIEQEFIRAREQLRKEVADIAVEGARKILQREIDAKAHDDILQDMVARL